jgi:hypothetical protein
MVFNIKSPHLNPLALGEEIQIFNEQSIMLKFDIFLYKTHVNISD